jgi:mannose-1-phosphate guanylyltransferase
VAEEYIKQSTMLWNIGMFCGKVSVFLDEFKKYAPELYHSVVHSVQHNDAFEKVPSISVDYALIEKSDHTWVLPVDFSWCDVGNVKTFLSLKQQENKQDEKVVSYNANNNLVDVPGKLVALVGVDDLCIIQSNDVLLIVHSSEAENVSAIVKQLKNQEWHEYM